MAINDWISFLTNGFCLGGVRKSRGLALLPIRDVLVEFTGFFDLLMS